MNNQLPTRPLGAFGTWAGGLTPSKSIRAFWHGTESIPWVSPKDMISPVINDTEDHVTKLGVQTSGLREYSPGSVMVVFRSGVLRHRVPVAIAGQNLTVNQDMKVLSVADDIDSSFAFHAIRRLDPTILAIAVKTGTTVESIDLKSFLDLHAFCPPLNEQRRIAAILDASEATIRTTEAVIEKLLTQIAGLTEAIFGSLLHGPSTRLQDLARDERESFIDGDWIEAPFITTSGIRLIQTGNIGVGDFIEKGDSRRYISKRSFDKLGCKWVKPGDILVCRLADPIGRACEVPHYVGPSVTAVDCTIFRPDERRVARRYILHWLNSTYSLKSAADIAGGSTRQRISRGNLGGLRAPLPPLTVQESVAATLDAAHGLVASEICALAKLRLQHQGLLHDLLTGAVRTRS